MLEATSRAITSVSSRIRRAALKLVDAKLRVTGLLVSVSSASENDTSFSGSKLCNVELLDRVHAPMDTISLAPTSCFYHRIYCFWVKSDFIRTFYRRSFF